MVNFFFFFFSQKSFIINICGVVNTHRVAMEKNNTLLKRRANICFNFFAFFSLKGTVMQIEKPPCRKKPQDLRWSFFWRK